MGTSVGGIKFYERAEIKDAVSYLRIINQKFDDLALERVIGSQKKVLVKVPSIKFILLQKNKLCLEDSILKLSENNELKPKIKTSLNRLIKMIKKWREDAQKMKHYDLLKLVLDESGYSSMLKNKKDLENENRLEEFKRAFKSYTGIRRFTKFFRTCLFSNVNRSRMGRRKNKFDDYACSKRFRI